MEGEELRMLDVKIAATQQFPVVSRVFSLQSFIVVYLLKTTKKLGHT